MKLSEAVRLLSDAGVEDARYDARELFRKAGGLSDADLFGTDPDVGDGEILPLVRRRAQGEPLAYLLGEWGFYRETYFVTPDCLVPRADTELLVDFAVRRIRPGARFLDLCTGSGCVALSTLLHTRATSAVATDVSAGALDVARKNASKYALTDRVTFLLSDLTEEFPEGTFDAILSNPPYVKDVVYPTLSREVHAEPKAAFLGGEDGMDFYRVILEKGKSHLAQDGFFAFEIGYDQEDAIRALGGEHGFSVSVLRDLGGNPRVAHLYR